MIKTRTLFHYVQGHNKNKGIRRFLVLEDWRKQLNEPISSFPNIDLPNIEDMCDIKVGDDTYNWREVSDIGATQEVYVLLRRACALGVRVVESVAKWL